MVTTVSVKELRPRLPTVIRRIDRRLERYVVTRRGKPVVVMLSVDDYESLMETLDLLADRRAMTGVRRGLEQIHQGKTRSWQEVKRSLATL